MYLGRWCMPLCTQISGRVASTAAMLWMEMMYAYTATLVWARTRLNSRKISPLWLGMIRQRPLRYRTTLSDLKNIGRKLHAHFQFPVHSLGAKDPKHPIFSKYSVRRGSSSVHRRWLSQNYRDMTRIDKFNSKLHPGSKSLRFVQMSSPASYPG